MCPSCSATKKAADRKVAQLRWRAKHTPWRKPCVVCGSDKGPGKGFKTCPTCPDPKKEPALEQLVRDQRYDMSTTFQPPQHFGDVHNKRGAVLHLEQMAVTLHHGQIVYDWERWGPEVDEWSDPVGDLALAGLEDYCGANSYRATR